MAHATQREQPGDGKRKSELYQQDRRGAGGRYTTKSKVGKKGGVEGEGWCSWWFTCPGGGEGFFFGADDDYYYYYWRMHFLPSSLPTLLQALILLTSSKKASVTLVFFFADVCTAE
jgi:hypothetical protein